MIQPGDRYRHHTGDYVVEWVTESNGITHVGLTGNMMTWTGTDSDLDEYGFERVKV